jgi:hypothetical protein
MSESLHAADAADTADAAEFSNIWTVADSGQLWDVSGCVSTYVWGLQT